MIYDVSVPIHSRMPVWPSDPPVKLTRKSSTSRDGTHTTVVTAIEMGSHTGTHLDAPLHMVSGGRHLHEIPLEQLIGDATVFQIAGVRSIGRAQLEPLDWSEVQRVLFKTENSKHWQDERFYEDFVYLEPGGAEFLVERGIQLVGIDYLSIDRYKSGGHPAHLVLLTKNVVLIEGLNLNRIEPGEYKMVALPLNLDEADGAPARVILMD